MKRFSLPIFSSSAPSAITLAIGVGLSAMTLAVQAQEKVLRIAMTAADIPRTLGQPDQGSVCLLYTSPSPRDGLLSRMPSSA